MTYPPDIALELLMLGNLYLLPELCRRSQIMLVDNGELDKENIYDLVELSFIYNATILRDYCFSWILKHQKQFMENISLMSG